MSEIKTLDGVLPDKEYSFLGIIKKVENDGEPDKKRPIRLIAQFEESKQLVKVCSWDYSLLEQLKTICNERNVCEISIKGNTYKETINFRLVSIDKKDYKTEILEEKEYNGNEEVDKFKNLITNLINQISNENYKKILNTLIMNNETFFTWKAAKSIHHSFVGGLVLHSYGVCANAINLANQYNTSMGFNVNYDLLITGALLHDIGKLQEYSPTGDITLLGEMISHLVLGVEMIDDACIQNNIDKMATDIIQLKHIIVSHHGKLEYGSPNTPILPEAYFVHFADMNDSKVESMVEALHVTNTGEKTASVKSLDDGHVYKTYM